MTLRGDSYSSTSEVKAFTRHLLDGQTAFNSTTRPSATELEKFIDRASGALNVALAQAGLTTPVTNTTAKLSCDDWVTEQAARFVELTQRGAGFNGNENERPGGFLGLHKKAMEFAKSNVLGFKYLGVGVTHKASDGLQFTGLDAQNQRTDDDDSSLEQPLFKRSLFNDPTTSDPDTYEEKA